MVGTLLVMLAMSNGLTLAGLSVFDDTLLRVLSTTIGALKFRDMVALVCAGAVAPIVGYAADRWGARPVIAFGLVTISLAMFLYSGVTTLWQIYVIHVMIGVAFASTNIVVIIILLTQWFEARRGLALGIVLSGTSLGGAIFPPLVASAISSFGWHTAFRILAALPLAFLPVMLLLLRERTGLRASAANAAADRVTGAADPRTWLMMVRTREFLILALVGVAVFYSANTFIRHSFLFLRLNGASAAVAAAGISTVFSLGLVGKVGAGLLLEYFELRWVFVGAQMMTLIGTGILITTGSAHAMIALGLVGLGWGAGYMLMQFSAARFFAGPGLGRLIGGFVIIESLAQGCGSYLTGVVHDLTGSYSVPFIVVATLMASAIIATMKSSTFRGN